MNGLLRWYTNAPVHRYRHWVIQGRQCNRLDLKTFLIVYWLLYYLAHLWPSLIRTILILLHSSVSCTPAAKCLLLFFAVEENQMFGCKLHHANSNQSIAHKMNDIWFITTTNSLNDGRNDIHIPCVVVKRLYPTSMVLNILSSTVFLLFRCGHDRQFRYSHNANRHRCFIPLSG